MENTQTLKSECVCGGTTFEHLLVYEKDKDIRKIVIKCIECKNECQKMEFNGDFIMEFISLGKCIYGDTSKFYFKDSIIGFSENGYNIGKIKGILGLPKNISKSVSEKQ